MTTVDYEEYLNIRKTRIREKDIDIRREYDVINIASKFLSYDILRNNLSSYMNLSGSLVYWINSIFEQKDSYPNVYFDKILDNYENFRSEKHLPGDIDIFVNDHSSISEFVDDYKEYNKENNFFYSLIRENNKKYGFAQFHIFTPKRNICIQFSRGDSSINNWSLSKGVENLDEDIKNAARRIWFFDFPIITNGIIFKKNNIFTINYYELFEMYENSDPTFKSRIGDPIYYNGLNGQKVLRIRKWLLKFQEYGTIDIKYLMGLSGFQKLQDNTSYYTIDRDGAIVRSYSNPLSLEVGRMSFINTLVSQYLRYDNIVKFNEINEISTNSTLPSFFHLFSKAFEDKNLVKLFSLIIDKVQICPKKLKSINPKTFKEYELSKTKVSTPFDKLIVKFCLHKVEIDKIISCLIGIMFSIEGVIPSKRKFNVKVTKFGYSYYINRRGDILNIIRSLMGIRLQYKIASSMKPELINIKDTINKKINIYSSYDHTDIENIILSIIEDFISGSPNTDFQVQDENSKTEDSHYYNAIGDVYEEDKYDCSKRLIVMDEKYDKIIILAIHDIKSIPIAIKFVFKLEDIKAKSDWCYVINSKYFKYKDCLLSRLDDKCENRKNKLYISREDGEKLSQVINITGDREDLKLFRDFVKEE